jgi:hypothetical protein
LLDNPPLFRGKVVAKRFELSNLWKTFAFNTPDWHSKAGLSGDPRVLFLCVQKKSEIAIHFAPVAPEKDAFLVCPVAAWQHTFLN